MKQINKIGQVKFSILAVALLILGPGVGGAVAAHAATLRVENNAVDSISCGSRRDPCRSISQAILNASDGDQILVGPGRYGELNGDGDFDDPGEEAANPICGNLTRGGVICIDKPVTVLSTHGAAATVLHANGIGGQNLIAVVLISSDKVIFGDKKKGFTLTDSAAHGLVVKNANKVIVAGNTALNNGTAGLSFGFLIAGDRGRVTAYSNVASGNPVGFSVEGNGMGQVLLDNNVATGNRASGFLVRGDAPHKILNNTASGNGLNGFDIVGDGYIVRRNIVTGNIKGFSLSDDSGSNSNHRFLENTVIGNEGAGFFFFASGVNNAVNRNNIYGNGGRGGNNCGLFNENGQTIDATNNFWGAVNGPGENPADNAGPNSGCDAVGNTVVEAFATKLFKIKFRGRKSKN